MQAVIDALIAAHSATTITEFTELTFTDSGAETLLITAKTAGKPFVIAASTTGQNGNETQSIVIANTPTGGTFTLTYDGQTTAGIAYDAAASAVDSALEALSNIGAGDRHLHRRSATGCCGCR